MSISLKSTWLPQHILELLVLSNGQHQKAKRIFKLMGRTAELHDPNIWAQTEDLIDNLKFHEVQIHKALADDHKGTFELGRLTERLYQRDYMIHKYWSHIPRTFHIIAIKRIKRPYRKHANRSERKTKPSGDSSIASTDASSFHNNLLL